MTNDKATAEDRALERITAWMEEHPDSFLTFSGGKDSTVLLHLLKRVDPSPKVCFFDSGLLYRQTYEFVENIQKWWGVDVTTIRTNPPPLELLKESGAWTPGAPKLRLDVKRLLIDNYLDAARAHYETIYSLYGLRGEESAGRRMLMARTKGVVTNHRKGELVGVSLAPMWDWTTLDVNSYVLKHKVPLNTAYRRLRELGVPSAKRRTGVVLGDGIHLGDWAMNYQVDPALGKVIESHLPMLAKFR